MTLLPPDFIWWITAVELPALGGLFALIWRTRSEHDSRIHHMQAMVEHRSDQLRDALSAFKLEVAKSYASHNDVRALEKRLVSHLLRIEAKLDTTALKAEALGAKGH